jgi:hypothetical protein
VGEAVSEFEKAIEALRTVEPDTQVKRQLELSPQLTLPVAITDEPPETQEEAPLELSPDLALPDAGEMSSAKASPGSSNQLYARDESRTEIAYAPRFAWLVDNIPRRMRAQVSVEAEIRVSSTIAPQVAINPVGPGGNSLHEVAQAMSLRLSAPRGGFMIEAQSPETQWAWSGTPQSVNELTAWRFILTPHRRGSNTLMLTFSCTQVGPNSLLTHSTLPDRVLDVVVTTNVAKTLTHAAVWVSTLIAGAVVGAYFQPAMNIIAGLY